MPKRVRVYEHGGPEVMRLEDCRVEEPGPGEVRIHQDAVGLNFIDTYHRSGLYPLALPSGLGLEAAGVIEAVGAGVDNFRVGDRVAYAAGPPGAYATARCLPADKVVPLPADITTETAAAALLKGMTVEYLINRTFAVPPGMTVLWHAAAGGVGLLACQWLAHRGVTVIGTVGSAAKAERAKAAGCAHTIEYTHEDVVARVRELTDGAGVPVVYDSVGRATQQQSLDCLAPRGLLVSFGNASGKPEPLDLLVLAQKGSLYVTRPTLMAYTGTRAELLASARALFEAIGTGAVRVEVGQRYPLEHVERAHRALAERDTVGSTILTIDA